VAILLGIATSSANSRNDKRRSFFFLTKFWERGTFTGKIETMIRKIKQEKLNKVFREKGVILAYLFGSVAKNKTGPLSDIDIAVLFNEKVPTAQYFDQKLEVMGKISDLFKTDNIDVVVLNEAPPLLAHRILKEGRVLFSKSEKKRLEFELRAIMKYLDWKPYLEKYTREVFT